MNATELQKLRESIKAAEPPARADYFKEGDYLCELLDLKFVNKNKAGVEKKFIFAEMKIHESSNPEIEVGSLRSEGFAFATEGYLGRYNGFVWSVLLGIKDETGKPCLTKEQAVEKGTEIYIALLDPAYGVATGLPENCLKGCMVRGTGSRFVTKKGIPIVGMKWFPV